jgi:hypothetical protein
VLHRLARLARLGEDRLGLALRLADQLAVLLEQPLRLVARLVGGVDRTPDRLPPLVDHVLDRPERVSLEDEEHDDEEDDRPDHQARDEPGERARDGDQHLLDEHEAEEAADEAVEDDGLGEGEAEPHDPLQLAAQLGLAGDRLDHRGEDRADADAGAQRAETHPDAEAERLRGLDRA